MREGLYRTAHGRYLSAVELLETLPGPKAKAAAEAFSIHYTPDLLARVRKMYAMDYALLRKVDAME